MTSCLIWLAASGAYGLFLAWYVNWSGPVKPDEIEAIMSRFARNGGAERARADAAMRRFLQADDGRAFFMLKLARRSHGAPSTAAPSAGRAWRGAPSAPRALWTALLLARAGHPVILARTISDGQVNLADAMDPGWIMMGYIRYRCRRDFALLASTEGEDPFSPAFSARRFSLATRPSSFSLTDPIATVALLVTLCACALQIWVLRVSA